MTPKARALFGQPKWARTPWALLAVLTTISCTLEGPLRSTPDVPAATRPTPALVMSTGFPVPPPTTAPSPPPTAPPHCLPSEMPGSVGALQALPAIARSAMETPIVFDSVPHDVALSAGSWPYLQATYNAKRNEYLAIWTQDPMQAETEQGLYAQRLDSNGRPLAGAVRLPSSPSHRHSFPRVAHDARHDVYMLAWSDDLLGSAYTWRLDGAGVPIGAPRSLGTGTGTPVVVYNALQQAFIVTWKATADLAGCERPLNSVVGQRFSEDGEPLASPFILLAASPHLYGYNMIHNTRDDGYLLAWCSASGSGLYVRRFDANGQAMSDPIALPVGPHPQANAFPAMAFHATLGDYLIAWGDGEPERYDVFARRLGPDGRPKGEAIRVTANPAEERPNQVLPTADGFLVTVVRQVTYRYDNGGAIITSTTRGQRISGATLLGPEVPLDLGTLGVAVTAGPTADSFLAFARDQTMKAQLARLPAP